MMDLNIAQGASVILVESNGQSYLIQNDANILNSVPCTESSIIGHNLPTIQSADFAFNLNCDSGSSSKSNLSSNQQIVAILDENQSQTFEITSEQAAELGLHFDGNDLSKRKLILSSGNLNSVSVSQQQEEQPNTSSLFNTNFNLSIVNSSPNVSLSSNDNQFLDTQLISATKKFTLEPGIAVENSPTKYPFLMEFSAKLNEKSTSSSSLKSKLPESIPVAQPAQTLLSPQSSVYDSIFLKEPVYSDLSSVSNLSDTVKGVKKKKFGSKKPRDGVADVRKKLTSLISVPLAKEDITANNPTVDGASVKSSSICDRETSVESCCNGAPKSPNSHSSSKSPSAQETMSMTHDISTNAQSVLKDGKKVKHGSNNAKKESKQESDERLDVTVNAQSLTKEQLKQIAKVFSKKHIMLDTKAPSNNVLYDPETNTRIICRVVYPEDFCKEKSSEPVGIEGDKKDIDSLKNNSKKRGRRSKLKEDEKASATKKNELKTVSSSTDSKKSDDTDQNLEKVPVQVSRTTRSGRVSRPPRHMSGNESPFQDDSAPTPFQSVSAQPKPEPKAFMFLPDVAKKRNVSAEFKCPTCDKVYLGQTKMAVHFEKNPTHRNMEKWNKILESLKKTDSQNKTGEEGLKPGLKPGLGKKKGKKRRTYEECKILLKKALEDCSKADVAVLAGPIVASVLSVWEFLVLRSAKMKLENENHVLALLRELKLLLNHIKSSADAFILPTSCSPLDSQSQTTNQIEIQDDATSHVLGLPCGKYCVNNDYENNWLKSFSERSRKITECDPNSKRSRQEEQINIWPNSDVPTQLPPPSPTETFDKGENDLNASNLLAESNHSSTAYIDEIMSQRLENLRTQQQNELNDCFTSVDDLINDLSVNISGIGKNPIDKCDPSLDLNFVNFPRNDLFQLSISDENRSVFPGSSSESGPCSSSLVSYVDDSMYDNMSSVITNASSTDDLMKSLASFELRPSDPMTFDPMNQFPLHENVSGASEFPDNEGFDRSVELSNLVSSRGSKSLKEDASDDLDFVHSLDCLNPSI